MIFRVGQKVVCVDAAETNNWNIPELMEGGIYTISWTDGPDVLLVEPTFRSRFGLNTPFRADRFRPIVERKTDIGFAHEILRKATRKQDANA